MMRLPRFTLRSPRSVDEAARILDGEGSAAMLLAGGTDLLPKMKRRQQTPASLIALRGIERLHQRRSDDGSSLGAGIRLSTIVNDPAIRRRRTALWQAAAQVASPQLRNMGTIGGNLCIDTRCNYYDQNYEWRKSIDFCLKKDGVTCWVATRSKRCVAVASSDTAPALIVLGARLRLVSVEGERELDLADFYRNDGIDYLARRGNEILTEIILPDTSGWRSCYWKLRRRGAFDFPVLGVAAAIKTAADGRIEDARIALGAVASRPFIVEQARDCLRGRQLDEDAIGEVSRLVASRAKPMDNTDLDIYWRKRVVPAYVGYALRELRGDDMGTTRQRTARIRLDAR